MTRTRNDLNVASLPAGISAGILSAVITTLCASALTAKLLQNQWLDVEKTGYGAMVILFFTAWIGSVVSQSRMKQFKIQVCLFFALTYFVLLLGIKTMFFEGELSGAGETALLIIGGSLLTLFQKRNTQKKKKRRNRKLHNR